VVGCLSPPPWGHDGLGREEIVLPTGDRWLEQNLLTLEHSDHPGCGPDLHAAPRANAIGAPQPVRPPDTHSSTEYIAITAAAMVLAPRWLGQPPRRHRPHLHRGANKHRYCSVADEGSRARRITDWVKVTNVSTLESSGAQDDRRPRTLASAHQSGDLISLPPGEGIWPSVYGS
jgi:hypothetical protein